MEMTMEDFNRDKYKRAKKQVEELKGFYIHLSIYLIVNAFILVNIYLNVDEFWYFPHFFPLIGWGVGVSFHGAKVFGFSPMMGKDWEKRMVQKFMDEEEREMDKYK